MTSKGALAAPFLIGAIALAGFVAPAWATESLAHLHVGLQSCNGRRTESVLGAFTFNRLDAPGALHRDLMLLPSSGETVAFDVDLPAGFYAYSVVAQVCRYESYIGLLPGKSRNVLGDMTSSAADREAPLLIEGTLPTGYSASLVRYSRNVDCGKSVAGAPTLAVDQFETEDYAYYFDDTPKEHGSKEAQFGLTITSPTGHKVVLVIEATYPPSVLNAAPEYVRYDVTPDLFQRALAHTPEGDAVCIGYPSTSSG